MGGCGLRQVVAHQSRELSQMSLFYNVQSVASANGSTT
jgi:hypothetical protein